MAVTILIADDEPNQLELLSFNLGQAGFVVLQAMDGQGALRQIEEHHPDLYWYGVHGCEALFTVMGTGCESVIRRQTEAGLIAVEGTWAGGRTGIFREGKGYSGLAKGDKGEAQIGNFDGYEPLVAEIIEFFKTKQAPIPAKETIELFAFMEAADESKRQGGKPVRLTDVLKKRK